MPGVAIYVVWAVATPRRCTRSVPATGFAALDTGYSALMSKRRTALRSTLRLAPGVVNLAGYDTAAKPSAPGGRGSGKSAAVRSLTKKTGPELASLQERLYAEASAGGQRRLLVVLQGMDTSGKGGVIDHVVGQLGPSGTTVSSFKKPTAEEAAHHFLWRIRRRLPAAGQIGVFDRSHYEDVLVVKVHRQVDNAEVTRRYEEINRFEAELTAAGTTVVKCFLHVSYATQRERLLARLDDPAKHWKFREADIDERQLWSDYQAAYADALEHTSTDAAPWYVIPADQKWYRNWAISELLREVLTELDPQFPDVTLDVNALKRRLQPPN